MGSLIPPTKILLRLTIANIRAVNAMQNKFREGMWHHRQPKRTMCGFGLQRSFGRIWLEYTRIIRVLSDAK